VLIHLDRGRLLNIYGFRESKNGFGHFLGKDALMNEVYHYAGKKESSLRPPSHMPV